ncbi:MAG: DUF5612 domain-containing protein [Spirochaetales bacterium]|nr:DUF5612 domain-containing protein [Spirochaetales bacterium]MCF7938117.1 DUF5612 domain-containing protein [Spirochaetales bacterium]
MKHTLPKVLRERYVWTKQHSARDEAAGIALEITADDRLRLVADILSRISEHGGNVAFTQSWNEYNGVTRMLIQCLGIEDTDSLTGDLEAIPSVLSVMLRPTYSKTYGKRVIVFGGGAQVGQVAIGAIAEADRHNIRGETISVDTSPIIGEEDLARAVRAVGRLHRASILVLAGALMGGEITTAVRELREVYGIPVIALSMAGSVVHTSDLIVSDPVTAGVMAVMLISHVGNFDLLEVAGKHF